MDFVISFQREHAICSKFLKHFLCFILFCLLPILIMSQGRRRNVNCLKNTVIWYEDHKNRCPYEPHLSELDPNFGMYTTAVWQCEAGHRYFQDLHSPLKPLSDSENECDNGKCPVSRMLTFQPDFFFAVNM